MRLHGSAILFAALTMVAAPLSAQTKYPGLSSVYPVAVERGKTSIVTIAALGELTDAYKVLLSGAGVTGRVLPRQLKQPAGETTVELIVDPKAALGPREIRVVTKQAITTLGVVYVTSLPVVLEAAANDSRAVAQPIQMPVAICGRIEKNVDEDWFRFEGKRGQRVSFTVLGVRLQDTIHKLGRFILHFDPILTLTDAKGAEIAVNDDYFFADSMLSAVLPRDGIYYIGLREATYRGSDMYTYALMGRFGAQPTHTIPLAARPGEMTTVKLVGPGFDGSTTAEITLPADVAPGSIQPCAPRRDKMEFGEVCLLASNLTRVLAERPAAPRAGARPKPQAVTLPLAVDGTLGQRGQTARVTFTVVKGTTYRFEVFARRLFTQLDSELRLFDAAGKQLAINDDLKANVGRSSKDSLIDWKAPSDMTCVLQLRDMMGRGGATFGYHLELTTLESDFELTCDPELLMLSPGNRGPIFVRTYRQAGFTGPIRLGVEGLPAGVTATAGTIGAGQQDGCIVLEVAKNAKVDAGNFRVTGTAEVGRGGKPVSVSRTAAPLAEIYQGQRMPVKTAAVAVTEASDILVETPVRRLELRPGESKSIPVKVVRNAKYKTGPIVLSTGWRFEGKVYGDPLPPGVTLDAKKSQTSLTGAQTEGVIALTAAANAAPSSTQIVIVGQVPIEFSVSTLFCAAPIEVVVLPAVPVKRDS